MDLNNNIEVSASENVNILNRRISNKVEWQLERYGQLLLKAKRIITCLLMCAWITSKIQKVFCTMSTIICYVVAF
jgi:hypothetical protein